jgi:hypothetical protein
MLYLGIVAESAEAETTTAVNASPGAVDYVISLPTGISPPGDSKYDGMNAFADGTLALKDTSILLFVAIRNHRSELLYIHCNK